MPLGRLQVPEMPLQPKAGHTTRLARHASGEAAKLGQDLVFAVMSTCKHHETSLRILLDIQQTQPISAFHLMPVCWAVAICLFPFRSRRVVTETGTGLSCQTPGALAKGHHFHSNIPEIPESLGGRRPSCRTLVRGIWGVLKLQSLLTLLWLEAFHSFRFLSSESPHVCQRSRLLNFLILLS